MIAFPSVEGDPVRNHLTFHYHYEVYHISSCSGHAAVGSGWGSPTAAGSFSRSQGVPVRLLLLCDKVCSPEIES